MLQAFVSEVISDVELRNALIHIKSIGKLPLDEINMEWKAHCIKTYMETYIDSLQIQRACCQAVSNVAMNIDFAVIILEKSIHTDILRSLQQYYRDDWKICWLACSAIWNLSRPEEYRHCFSNSTCDLVMAILRRYSHQCKVVNTSIGALSNLSLHNNLKLHIAQEHNLESIFAISSKFINNIVSCTTAGLMANLAVNDDIADTLVEMGAISMLTQMLNKGDIDRNFQKNIAAALSNLTTSDMFIRDCLINYTVEHLFILYETTLDVGIIGLITNCFTVLGIDPSAGMTTTLHMACYHDEIDLLDILIVEEYFESYSFFDVNAVDGFGFKMSHYALANDSSEIMFILIKFGASSDFLATEYVSKEMNKQIVEAEFFIQYGKKNVTKLFLDIYTDHEKSKSTCAKLNEDVTTIVLQFLSCPDIYHIAGLLYAPVL